MRKKILNILFLFIVGIVGGIFADQILWPYFVERPLFNEYRLEKNPIYVTEVQEKIIQENSALKDSIEKVERSVVALETATQTEILHGSGIILTSDGLVVTLAELVPQGANTEFFLDGKKVSFQILKRDLDKNLALVKLEKDNLSTVSFGDFENIDLGERIFIAGAIFKSNQAVKGVNEGIVTYLGKDTFQTNILEIASFSGSPLFNIKGEMLGLTTVDFWGRVSAIPVNEVRSFVGL
jgi:S1-C subfamily serine protease